LALDTDASGVPHLLRTHITPTAVELHYSTNLSGSWASSTVEPAFTYEPAAFLALSTSGVPHVAYSQDLDTEYAVMQGTGGWQRETLVGLTTPVAFTLDPADRPIVVVRASATELRVHVREAPATWNPTPLPVASLGTEVRIAAPPDGLWHVFYDVGRHAWRPSP
jgi:hypothetical protein